MAPNAHAPMAARWTLALAVSALALVPPLVSALLPQPEATTDGPRTFCVRRKLRWVSVGYSSDILLAGFDRYAAILDSTPLGIGDKDDIVRDAGFARAQAEDGQADEAAAVHNKPHARRCRVVRKVEVSVTSSDQSLTLETRESYSLGIDGGTVQIQANSVYGALRAFESLAQLVRRRTVERVERDAGGGAPLEGFVPPGAVWPVDPSLGRHNRTVLLVDEVDMYDAPRFRYRGLLLDVARHFLPVSVIKQHLEAMAMVKMNCLHLHLTDDESFPWASEELPDLAAKGAFAPEAVYTADDIRDVVEFARFRGIRVIPELDTPGHTLSWGKSMPELLTRCYTPAGEPSGQLGPLNPARNATFGFIWRLLREVARTFPDPYIHLGGDEVDHECWKSNPEVQEFMRQHDFTGFSQLEGYYMEQVVRLAATAGKSAIVWQEAFDQGVPLPPYTRVQVWKWWKDRGQAAGVDAGSRAGNLMSGSAKVATAGVAAARRRALLERPPLGSASCSLAAGCAGEAAVEDEAWKAELQAVTGRGYDAILSAPWYLNLGSYSGQDWRRYYSVDPTDFSGTPEQRDRVLGGTACAWGEYIDAVNSVNRVWPRAAAIAERLWSPADTTDTDEAATRLADLRCRMLSRGIAAQSIGPGFCPGELTTRM